MSTQAEHIKILKIVLFFWLITAGAVMLLFGVGLFLGADAIAKSATANTANLAQTAANILVGFGAIMILFGLKVFAGSSKRKPEVGEFSALIELQHKINWFKRTGHTMLVAGIGIVLLGIGTCTIADPIARLIFSSKDAKFDDYNPPTTERIESEVAAECTNIETIGVLVFAAGATLGLVGFIVQRRGVVLEARKISHMRGRNRLQEI